MNATAHTRILYIIMNTRRNAQGTTITVCYALQRRVVSVVQWVLMQCGKIHVAFIFRVEMSRVCKVEGYMTGARGNKGYLVQGYPFKASVFHTEDGGSIFYCTLLPAARLHKTEHHIVYPQIMKNSYISLYWYQSVL